MGVRVPLELTAAGTLPGPGAAPVLGAGKPIRSAAVVNSGFEAASREAILPVALGAALGFDPSSPGALVVSYSTVGGPAQVFRFLAGARARVVAPDRSSAEVLADVVLVPMEREVLISDSLGEALGIVILGLRSGEWCFADELGARRRPSDAPRFW